LSWEFESIILSLLTPLHSLKSTPIYAQGNLNIFFNMQNETEITTEQALNRLMKLCSTKEMCSFDLRRKLELWGLDSKQQEKILRTLEKERFFSDERYSAAFVNDKSKFQKWGKVKIKHALLTRHIAEDIIDGFLKDIPEIDYSGKLEELLKQKLRSLKISESDMQKRARLYRFAAGRGYESDMIFKALNKLLRD
jgi:regulatory protein